jgi:hypothetical protein
MQHVSPEDGMIRLASFLGFAVLALAAYALAGPSAPATKGLSPDKDKNKEEFPPGGHLGRIPALAFHARFSVN